MHNICKVTVFFMMVFMQYGLSKSSTPTSGPFRSYMNSTKVCTKPTYPWHPNPPVTWDIEIYKHPTYGPSLRGTLKIHNDTSGFKMRTKSMIYENGKWKTNFIVVDNGCRGSLMPFWMTFFNIKFDKKKCALLECEVPINIVNSNKLHHIITKTAEYGRVLFINEMFMVGKQYKTVYCHEFECVIEPI